MSLKGRLPAVSRVKLKGYALLKFSLMTLSVPEWLVHSGGAPADFIGLCSLLLVSEVLFWRVVDIRRQGVGGWGEWHTFWRASDPRARFQENSGVTM